MTDVAVLCCAMLCVLSCLIAEACLGVAFCVGAMRLGGKLFIWQPPDARKGIQRNTYSIGREERGSLQGKEEKQREEGGRAAAAAVASALKFPVL